MTNLGQQSSLGTGRTLGEQTTSSPGQATAELERVLQLLEHHEIGFLIEHVPCAGFTVRLGDEMNGYLETGSFKNASEIANFLKSSFGKHTSP